MSGSVSAYICVKEGRRQTGPGGGRQTGPEGGRQKQIRDRTRARKI